MAAILKDNENRKNATIFVFARDLWIFSQFKWHILKLNLYCFQVLSLFYSIFNYSYAKYESLGRVRAIFV